jgi:hypothetical protein
MSFPNTDPTIGPTMSFPCTDASDPLQEFPDDLATMYNTQAQLFADQQMWWDTDATLDYDGTFSFARVDTLLTNKKNCRRCIV